MHRLCFQPHDDLFVVPVCVVTRRTTSAHPFSAPLFSFSCWLFLLAARWHGAPSLPAFAKKLKKHHKTCFFFKQITLKASFALGKNSARTSVFLVYFNQLVAHTLKRRKNTLVRSRYCAQYRQGFKMITCSACYEDRSTNFRSKKYKKFSTSINDSKYFHRLKKMLRFGKRLKQAKFSRLYKKFYLRLRPSTRSDLFQLSGKL